MIAANHKLVIGESSMIGWSIENQKPRIALDVGQEAVRFNNPYLPLTRSEMALPLIVKDRVLGAMSVQSIEQNAFDEDDIVVLQSIADSLSTSIENARLFRDSRENLEEIQNLQRQYLDRAWTETALQERGLSYQFEDEKYANEAAGSAIQLPLSLREQIIGQITVETGNTSLSPDEMALVDAITTQTALALENARLLNETQRNAAREQLLNDMAARFSRALNIDDILKIAVRELGRLPTVTEASVYLKSLEEQIVAGPNQPEG